MGIKIQYEIMHKHNMDTLIYYLFSIICLVFEVLDPDA